MNFVFLASTFQSHLDQNHVRKQHSSLIAVLVVLCDLNLSLFLAFCVGHALPTKKQRNPATTKDESIRGSYWNDNRKSQHMFPTLMPQWKPKQIMSPHSHTPAERSSAFFLRVMEMLGCEIWAEQMSLDKAKFKWEPWDSKFSFVGDRWRESWWAEGFFFCFFS